MNGLKIGSEKRTTLVMTQMESNTHSSPMNDRNESLKSSFLYFRTVRVTMLPEDLFS